MDGTVECAAEIRTEDINVWDGARVHTVTGKALAMAKAASTASMNKSVVKKAPKRKKSVKRCWRRQL